MKNIIKSLALAAVVLVSGASFTACKKGENDPGIPLASRKGRLVGEWKVTAGVVKSSSGGVTQTETYTETGKTTTYSSGGSLTATWSQTLTIEKDGTFLMTESETPQGGNTTTSTIKGRWMFAGKNKDAELKNK